MTRMIERWFPCADVSANSRVGWGSGNAERSMFTWFAARPTVQAKAALITSLLPWPEDESEQRRLQSLVKEALTGRYAAWNELRAEVLRENPNGVAMLDPFSGRGMIPVEAARLGFTAHGVDYSHLAYLASTLLVDYPFRDWNEEPTLPFQGQVDDGIPMSVPGQRLLEDLTLVMDEVNERFTASMREFYPRSETTWGYLWATTLPCQECGRRFPLIGSYELRKVGEAGQSYYIDADPATGEFEAVVHEGPPRRTPTLTSARDADGRKIAGKSAVCPFCDHVHPLGTHRRLASEGLSRDALLLAADHVDGLGKVFREITREEQQAAAAADDALRSESSFSPIVPAVPNEEIAPGNNNIIGPSIYGARTYGDFMCGRQTLSFIRLARTVNEVGEDLLKGGVSTDYARALTGYMAAVIARKIRRSTRSATLEVKRGGTVMLHDIYANQGSIGFSYDFFEAGLGDGPGTLNSLSRSTLSTLRNLIEGRRGAPGVVQKGSATDLSFATGSMDVVVTDPPYDEMVAYADSSDLIYSWVKRALTATWPELSVTSDAGGAQDKAEEIIVKRVRGEAPNEHRTREHYDSSIARAFQEMRRVVRRDGLVTIVFGHGEPEVWQRLLAAITQANLVMTGSWPATTEAGSHQGKANIETTLTMSCRPAQPGRPEGRRTAVEAQVKDEVTSRVRLWEKSGLAPTDMLMAAAGPAMEAVGRYSQVLDSRAEPVDVATFLPLARQAVQEAMAVDIDQHPLEVFDARTRFALWWIRLYGRQVTAKSELRWQVLAASMDLAEVRDLAPDAGQGCRFVTAEKFKAVITPESPVIDVVLAMAKASEDGLAAVSEVVLAAGRDADDTYLWATMRFLSGQLPDADPDAIAFSRILRNRTGLSSAARTAVQARNSAEKKRQADGQQLELL
ncbi:DUF1156 domain-containing protein [Saccharopolyspora sp. HNM0986]|uniref:DUF1156 domain-containing protein n=1 Tax=Saccharopolyspora galaxeae TaxID=2781241 RepID=UPI00190CC006|nr:DUF1156 domain-containing protein [Saccharopolyspora sp. HNM0986]MBK0869890.1 DUF1156 domain-containing protein [Saccharopolyspora sp. HNM0986]